ncbi:MAG TPA: arsenate reductase ArsC [Bacteroidaceae bacterium]|nr:arsenate reductase ArsC [Bacteroidaceae bacterium]
MKRVLVLCTGNSCRSQMTAAFLKELSDNLEVHSAGTAPAPAVNAGAVKYMAELGIDISKEIPTHVDEYIAQAWDYVITVCGGANENCPVFVGEVGKRLHIGFDDPSHATGTPEFIESEFRRVRDEIKVRFTQFIAEEGL